MGIATEHSPAPYGGMSAYSCWEIDLKMFNGSMEQIDAFTCRQDLWISSDQFVVRLTRKGDSKHARPTRIEALWRAARALPAALALVES